MLVEMAVTAGWVVLAAQALRAALHSRRSSPFQLITPEAHWPEALVALVVLVVGAALEVVDRGAPMAARTVVWAALAAMDTPLIAPEASALELLEMAETAEVRQVPLELPVTPVAFHMPEAHPEQEARQDRQALLARRALTSTAMQT